MVSLVVDHKTEEILAWVNAGNKEIETKSGYIDAILTPRQPGSTLKPFIYAMALANNDTPATLIEDTPIDVNIGEGVHKIKNYSRLFYGPLTLRQSLANSLNIPAVRTIKKIGIKKFYTLLKELGFKGLTKQAIFMEKAFLEKK